MTTTMRPRTSRRAFVGCAAAAFGTLSSSSSCWAFLSPHHHPSLASDSASAKQIHYEKLLLTKNPSYSPRQQQSMRLFFSSPNSNNKNNEDDDWETLKKASGKILKKARDKIKSILPFGKNEEEKRSQLIKKQPTDEIKVGINAMLKDMPLPMRLMGRMVAPMLSMAANELAEQSRQAADMIEEARIRIVNDPDVTSKLGTPIQVSQPFSQSSSTMVINGKSSARLNASFQVGGPYGSGIAMMESSDGEIVNLVVNINGMNINVGSRKSSSWGSSSDYGSSSSSSSKKGDIIEAEIIEKK